MARRLRLAASVFFALIGVAVIVLWMQSYYAIGQLSKTFMLHTDTRMTEPLWTMNLPHWAGRFMQAQLQ
jgi:hypothetical protein